MRVFCHHKEICFFVNPSIDAVDRLERSLLILDSSETMRISERKERKEEERRGRGCKDEYRLDRSHANKVGFKKGGCDQFHRFEGFILGNYHRNLCVGAIGRLDREKESQIRER